MVIYDVNRRAAVVELMNEQPPDLVALMREQAPFNFTLSLLTNSSPDTQNVHIVKLKSGSREPVYKTLELEWPNSIYSLSHIALPFTPDDPIYGESGPHQQINLGMLSPRGERNVLNLNPDYFLRLRHNPFYDYQKDHISVWIEQFIQ